MVSKNITAINKKHALYTRIIGKKAWAHLKNLLYPTHHRCEKINSFEKLLQEKRVLGHPAHSRVPGEIYPAFKGFGNSLRWQETLMLFNMLISQAYRIQKLWGLSVEALDGERCVMLRGMWDTVCMKPNLLWRQQKVEDSRCMEWSAEESQRWWMEPGWLQRVEPRWLDFLSPSLFTSHHCITRWQTEATGVN